VTSTHPAERTAPDPADRTVAGYRLLTRIGEGGMGVVHLAETADGDRVALKVLRPHVVGDDEGRTRLAREVASLRQVRSPHVAEILDADPWGEIPFIVTRYVPGLSLHETVQRDGVLPPDDLEFAGRRLLEAVRHVHASDVLHRDLKPTNVVMEGRAPVLIDFGLARLAEDPRLTATGWLLGTPGYLAPEVLLGDPATAATDVHGWAATMVYAASGRPPYGRGHTMAILERTRRGEADLDLVPEPFRALFAACLAPEPLERPTALEALAALGAARSGPVPLLAAAPAPAADDPVTMPWQLVRHEDPATEVLDAVAEPATDVVPLPTRAVPPPTRIAPAPAPAPAYIAPTPVPSSRLPVAPPPAQARPLSPVPPPVMQPIPPMAPPPGPPPLTAWGRLRRSLLLLGAVALVAAGFRVAPYLTLATVAAGVLAVRGLSHSQQASWRRRSLRGRRWFDGPASVLAYPYHLLRGGLGAVLLLLVAGWCALVAAGGLLVFGLTTPDVLLGAGAVLAWGVWWGPGGGRVRQPLGQAATAASRRAGTWAVPALLVASSVAVLLVAHQQAGVLWAPATDAPWSGLVSSLPRW
jgi:serine/threonine protein kinase